MELLHMTILCAIFMPLLLLAFTRILLPKSAADDGFPPGPPAGAWPLLGHLPFLIASGLPPHQALAPLARRLGPIIGLRLGSTRAVVICNSLLAKEVLHSHDKLLANRPRFLMSDNLLYGYDATLTFSRYTPRWAMLRKLCNLELFTAKRLQALQPLRYKEVHNLLQSLLQESHHGTQPVNLAQSFLLMNSNSLGRALHSEPIPEVGGHVFYRMLKEQERFITPTIGDLLPWLKLLDLPRKQRMRKHHGHVDKIIETMVSQRRQLMKSSKADDLPNDLLQVLLSREAIDQEQSDDQDELLTTKEIKGAVFDMLSAGTHTIALTLEWTMAELLRNPNCLKKLQNEIDDMMAKEGNHFITDEDIPKLPYLEKVVKEVFRLHPSVPLLIPRISNEAVKIDKFTLPAGTHVFVNVWAIGRDPDVWENAEKFLPERFDGKDMDVKGQHYDLLPFGAGRRVCLGLRLALSVFHVTLANLIRTFEWELPYGQTPMDVDMSEQRGFTTVRLTPMVAIPKPRFKLDMQ
ncbi:hypothetical protein L7F22_046014 [Adiantum nelumboides]|nr:hypothetical protein [Adiantum nelumboides]